MSPAVTLVSLACAIANGGPIDMSSVAAQLNNAEKAVVQEIIDSGMCLPERLEKLILKSEANRKAGRVQMAGAAPSYGCF